MLTVQQALAADDGSKLADLLFTTLSQVSQGQDLSNTVADVAQGVLNSKWNVQVKRLAYELCKAVPLSDSDSRFIIAGVRSDITSGAADASIQALLFLPHMQPHLLAQLLSNGELAALCRPALVSDTAGVRAAVVQALGAVLLVPDVLAAAAADAVVANQVNEHWQGLTDALLDEEAEVVDAAVGAAAALLRAGLAADTRMPEGFLLDRLAIISGARVASALGAVLHAAGDLPAGGRVGLLQLLQLLVQQAVKACGWEPRDVGGSLGLPSGTLLPGLANLAPAVWGAAADGLRAANAALRLESARSILYVAALVSQPGMVRSRHPSSCYPSLAFHTDGDGPGSASEPGVGSVPVPTSLVLDALDTLLELEEALPFAEATSEDVVGAALLGVTALPRPLRLPVMHRLWQAVSRVKVTPVRVQLCAQAWAVLLDGLQAGEDVSPAGPDAAAQAVTDLLSDSYLHALMSGHLPSTTPSLASNASFSRAGPAASAGSVSLGPGAAGAAGSAPPAAAPAAIAASTDELLSRGPSEATRPPSLTAKAGKSRLFGLLKSKDTGGSVKDAASVKSGGMLAKMTSMASSKGSVDPGIAAAAAAAVSAADAAAAYQASLAAAAAGDSGHTRKTLSVPVSGGQRHELVAALLGVLSGHHPTAPLAAQLCGDVAGALAVDKAAHSALGTKYGASAQARVLDWVATARAALQATQACLTWEPVVVPGITHQVNAAAAQRPPADLSSSVADLWLQLLQAAAAAARAVHALQQHTQQTLPAVATLALNPTNSVQPPSPSAASAAAGGGGTLVSHPSVGASSVATTRTGGPLAGLSGSPLAVAATKECRELTNIMKYVLREWGGLTRAVRPRALWVVCHGLDMAPHADEQWELGLKALHDTLCKLVPSSSAGRVSDLLSSAATGILFASGRLGWPRDRPFVFDVVASAALCEKPDYEASALVVGLATAQAWTTRLQDALAASSPDTAKRVTSDVLFHAARLDGVLREFLGTLEASGSPVLREWCKRTLRALAGVATWVHPVVRAAEEAEKAAQEAKEKEERDAAKAAKGIPDVADDDSSVVDSDSSSSYDGGGDLLPVSLPTAMYLPPGAARGARPALPPAQQRLANTGPSALPNPMADGLGEGPAGPGNGFASGLTVNAGVNGTGGPQDTARDQESFKQRAALTQGTLPSHVAASGASHHPWGYPFSSTPRISCLFNGKRARRARMLATHLAAALRRVQLATSAASPDTGAGLQPSLPGYSLLRLDSPTFWAMLPGGSLAPGGATTVTAGMSGETGPGGTATGATSTLVAGGGGGAQEAAGSAVLVRSEELCGPGDPVLLTATVLRTPDAAELLLKLSVINRSEIELRSAVVALSAVGPVLLDRRALSWGLPRIPPGDRVSQTFTLRLLGYGDIQLQTLLQLVMVGSGAAVTTPVMLVCKPVHVGLVQHQLVAPTTPPPARDFFALWGALPARTNLTASCVWPGRDGAARALSCMLRSPLACVMLTYVSATATYQAAFAGETSSGESVLVVVHAQLLPGGVPPAPATAPLTAAPAKGDKKDGKRGSAPGEEDDAAVLSPRSSSVSAARRRPGAGVTPSPAGKATAPGAPAAGGPTAVVQEEALGPGDTPRPPAALLHIAVRSSLPDVTLGVSAAPAAFLRDLTAGSAVLPGVALAGAGVAGGAGALPPLHPRVAALEAAHAHSLRALPSTVQSLLGGAAAAGTAAAGTAAGTGVDVYAQGSKAGTKVSHKWMEAAALAEWQRLVAQPV